MTFMAALRYQELEPDPALRRYVLCYWAFSVQAAEEDSYLHRVMPDGCVILVYSRSVHRPAFVGLSVPQPNAYEVPVQVGEIYWGVRCWPGAFEALFHIAPLALEQGRGGIATAYLPALSDVLISKLDRCETSETAAQIFDAVLLNLLPNAKEPNPIVRAGVEAIVASQGQQPIGEIAAQLCLGERQFQRRFREAVGLTPKQFARIRRFRTSAGNILQANPASWGQVAAEQGYADQAHLAREFSQLVGLPPTTFQQRLQDIEHINVKP